ncbi:hypothetical protein MMC12_002362 [Toensbergia leucococca]|nr:hypothetical protein [Toensbergia leucococca]
MPSTMDVIALISGGKDSVFSILHCLANGHRVVALANLYPPGVSEASSLGPEDLNSYMYQTVGHKLIPLFSTTLGIPLYREEISGSAVNAEKDYMPTSLPLSLSSTPMFDETESLLSLLRRVLAAHPTVTAVVSGAILSTYQRTRIESVAFRLHLFSLAYLWQYPYLPTPIPRTAGLLEDMASVGLDARIVKVASGGLDEELLWENVSEERVRNKLSRAIGRFGGSVLGEGGEYETLVVGGPKGVWSGTIEVGNDGRWVRRGGGGEAWLEVQGGGIANNDDKGNEAAWRENLNIPKLFDDAFEQLWWGLVENSVVPRRFFGKIPVRKIQHGWKVERVFTKSKSGFRLSNLNYPLAGSSIKDQMQAIYLGLLSVLAAQNCSTEDIVFTTILLRSMDDYEGSSVIYGSFFPKPNPPARIAVACGDALPPRVKVMASFVVDLGPRKARSGLHVQSRSYWAPANIGPYSQAISVPIIDQEGPHLVHLAGQIPLIPATMELLGTRSGERTDGLEVFRKQACLSLQHLWRIGKVTNVNWWTKGIAFIVGESRMREKAKIAWSVWRTMHENTSSEDHDSGSELADLDPWDKKYGGLGSVSSEHAAEQCLPDFKKVTRNGEQASTYADVPNFFVVQVDELPRGAKIEWQSLGVANGTVNLESSSVGGVRSQLCTISGTAMSVTCFGWPLEDTKTEVRNQIKKNVTIMRQPRICKFVTVYTRWASDWRFSLQLEKFGAQIIPCRYVWGADGQELSAGIIVYREKE